MIEIVFASQNEHKIFEMNEIASPYGVKFIVPQAGFDPVENGATFVENAIIKAVEASRFGGGELFLSDDSGLCVDALGGEPGVKSARYAPTNDERIEKVLKNLERAGDGVSRGAQFVCSMALCNADGKVLHTTEDICRGKIVFEPKGEGGFGYDPIFVPDGFNATLAEISQDEKNAISHRGKALREMLLWMRQALK